MQGTVVVRRRLALGRWGAALLSVLLICEVLLIPARPTAYAAGFTIGCGDSAGLIAAINTTNSSAGADTITLAAGCTYTLTAVNNNGVNGPNGLPVLAGALTINGNGATIARSAAVGTPQFRLIEVAAGAIVSLNALQITNGISSSGGGILNAGNLTVNSSTIAGNSASSGGGIYAIGAVTISRSTFNGNATIANDGGALFAGSGAIMSITNSTFGGNSSVATGGALVTVFAAATAPIVTINNSTFSGNSARAGGGGAILVFSGSVTLQNSIVANSPSGGNCVGTSSAGNNLSSDGSCGGATGDLLNTNPQLGPLADNGGPTLTFLPAPASPAINAGNNVACPATDQRGATRPSGPACDIGAVEFAPQAGPAFTVTNTSDTAAVCEFGACSLRAAITSANAAPNGAQPDTIRFSIGSGTQMISPTLALPVIADPVIIDGYTQPGASTNTLAVGNDAAIKIELNGDVCSSSCTGIVINASGGGSTIRGLAIYGGFHDAIALESGGGNTIAGNFMGLRADGTPRGVRASGIYVNNTTNNTIGGITPAARNVISANIEGIFFAAGAGPTTGNLVQGNYIGVNPAGSAAGPGNSNHGIFMGTFGPFTLSNNTIGGTTPAAGNIIAANPVGVMMNGSTVSGNTVQGNYIGVQANGVSPLGNTAGAGIDIRNASSNILIQDNAISNNSAGGVVISASSAITIAHNLIASNAGRGLLLGGDGNFITGNSIDANAGDGITINSSGNRISEATTWGGNVITRNAGRGINVVSGDKNEIIRNAIYNNADLGIDLGGDGVTPNDAGDADAGPNNRQNTPAISAADIDPSGNLVIQYGVDSLTTSSAYPLQIEFYAAGATGDQGRTLLGSDTLAGPGARTIDLGNAAALGVAAGDRLVATATDGNGNTSEFAAPIAVKQAPKPTPKPTHIVLSPPRLQFSSTPYGVPAFAVSGRGFDIEALIVDANGAIDNFSGTVTVTLALRAGSGTPGAVLSGARSATATNGVATFYNLSIDRPGSGYQLLAAAGNVPNSLGDPFDVLEPETEAPLPNNTIDAATVLGALPAERAGWINTSDDADWFLLDTGLTGATVAITLTNLPADYDLALVSDPRPRATAPVSDGVRLTNLIDANQTDASGRLTSVSLAEALTRIGAVGNLPGAAQLLLTLSAHQGAESETITTQLPRSGHYYILVYSASGASDNSRPYRLNVSLAGGTPAPLPPPALPVASLTLTPDPQVQTIFLYNLARMQARYTDQKQVDAIKQLVARLTTPDDPLMTASHGSSIDLSGGQLPSASLATLNTLYAAWDAPDSQARPAFANQVAQQIWYTLDRAITSYYTGTVNLVLVGGDDIIPFYRVPDETVRAPESDYYGELLATGALSATAPLSGSLSGNFIQTDDFYADRAPTTWRGRELYMPDLGVGRLVERPSEIVSYLDAYAGSDYTIDASTQPATALVTGYGFVADEAQVISGTLKQLGFQPGGQLALGTLISDTWNVDQLTGLWLGGQSARPQLDTFNGHFNHTQLIAADYSVLSATQLLNKPAIRNALIFAVGCHSGLSATDRSFGGANAGALQTDFAQAVLQNGGNWIGNTGFIYADPQTIGYSQQLAQLFTQQIGRPVTGTLPLTSERGYVGAPIGESLARAKQAYLRALGPNGLSVSDEKALTQLTLYGLPFMRVKVPNPQVVPEPERIQADPQNPEHFPRLITITNRFAPGRPVDDGEIPLVYSTITDSFKPGKTIHMTSTNQLAPGRPVLPVLAYDITLQPDPSCPGPCELPQPRGVQLLSATTTERAGFMPHVTTPVTDPIKLARLEPDMTAKGVWLPDLPYTFQRTSAFSGTVPITSDRLLLNLAQFNATNAAIGRLRQFDTMVFEISYAKPPKRQQQVLGCWILQRFCNWISGKSRVSKKKRTTLTSQAIGPAQVQETLVLSTEVTLKNGLLPASVVVSATYTIDGVNWQRVTLERQPVVPSTGATTTVTYTKEVTAPTWPLREFAAFFEFRDQDGNVLVTTPRAAPFYQIFLPLAAHQPPPDLVGSISLSPDKRVFKAFKAGEPVQFTVTITNDGEGDAGPFWVDLFINPSSPPTVANVTWNQRCGMKPCFGLAWQVPDGLRAGESVTLTSTQFPPGYSIWPGWFAAGTTDLYLYVDSYNPPFAYGAVPESSEGNNQFHLGGLTVTGKNPPLLSVQSVDNLPARPAP